ncbi:ornithine cyclodeaminase family protein [Clostridium subterminale]|uniref:Ornithine cyclodeaminase family protein n=1 Tax=Clostridium subterminale TaxID=1550 RepID=A0ABP3W4Y2_CLOSU
MLIPIRVLGDDDIRRILDIKNTVACVEQAYVSKADNRGRIFSMISEEIFQGRAEIDIKSSMLNEEDVFGLKLVSWFGDNAKLGLPTVTGLTMLFDLNNGFPKAIINAGYLTGMRTGAAGAVGVKYLTKNDSRTLMVVGTGVQAIFQIAATLSEVQTINKVYIYDPLKYESAIRFKNSIKVELSKILNDVNDPYNISWKQRIESVEFTAIESPAKALEETDAVITVTPSRKPLILKEWVRTGTHFSCMGADTAGKQEIDEKIFDEAVVYVDDIAQALTVGETQNAIRVGKIEKNNLTEIGELILGNVKGRIVDKEITIFDSTGISLQDIAVSQYIVLKAEEMNIGTMIQI